MRKLFLGFLVVVAVVFFLATLLRDSGDKAPLVGESQTRPGWPSPTSVFCIKQGGRLESRQAISGGEFRVCKFENGGECELVSFYKNQCNPFDDQI